MAMRVLEFEQGAYYIGEGAIDHFDSRPEDRPWKPLNMVSDAPTEEEYELEEDTYSWHAC